MSATPVVATCDTHESRMAPRFVEVSRPVEESVKLAWSLPQMISSRLQNATNGVSSVRLVSDIRSFMLRRLALLPLPNREVQILLVTALVALVVRYVFVFLRSRWILSAYGAAKLVSKES